MLFRVFYSVGAVLAFTLASCYPRATPLNTSTNEVSPPQFQITEVESRGDAHQATVSLDTVTAPREEVSLSSQDTVLVAEDIDTQINVRTGPSTDSAVIGAGFVGDTVTVSRLSKAEDGYNWYYVELNAEKDSGWVREDFIDTVKLPTAPAFVKDSLAADNLVLTLDSHCNGLEGVETYYRTASFITYICNPHDRPIYISNQIGTSQVLVTEDVETSLEDDLAYVARHDNYEYHISEAELVVYRASDRGGLIRILQENVSIAERY